MRRNGAAISSARGGVPPTMARIIAGRRARKEVATLSKRTITTLLGAAFALLIAVPAEAALVYVKDAGDAETRVWVARDDGTQARKVGLGHSPRISDDGRWIAWIQPGSTDQLMLRLADRSRKARVVGRSSFVRRVPLLAGREVARARAEPPPLRLRHPRARGGPRGLGRHPRLLVLARLGVDRVRDRRPQRRRRRAVRPLLGRRSRTRSRRRITRDRKSLNPLWGPSGIVHDRFSARDGDAPDVQRVRDPARRRQPAADHAAAGAAADERPRAARAVGRRQAACWRSSSARTRSVAFRVNPETGKTKALDDDFENGLVGFDLTADGRTVLGHTGGPDPTARHNVVTVPYGGGEPEVLVRRAVVPGLGSVTRPAARVGRAA